MMNKLFLLLLPISLGMSSCDCSGKKEGKDPEEKYLTPEEKKDFQTLDSLKKREQVKMDSMKKALGL